MERHRHLPIVAGTAVLLVLLVANLVFEFDFETDSPDQPSTRHQAARLIEAANYCEAASDCVLVRGGDWSDGQCRWGDILVNAAEAHRMPQLCDMAYSPRFFFIYQEVRPGLDQPQCVAGKCVARHQSLIQK